MYNIHNPLMIVSPNLLKQLISWPILYLVKTYLQNISLSTPIRFPKDRIGLIMSIRKPRKTISLYDYNNFCEFTDMGKYV